MIRLVGIVKCIFLLISTFALSQELPPIENYLPKDYNGGNQNWSISQTDNNYIYVANNSGLLEFNGAAWKLYPSPNGTIIRSVEVIEELLYTGCYMEFGYWKKDEFGKLNYFSLVDSLPEPLIEDEHFWNILGFDQWVLFQSLDRIYIFNTVDNTFNIIDSKSTRAKIFSVGKSIFFQKINEGLFKIERGIPILVSDDDIVKRNVIVGVFQANNSTLLVNELGQFYYLEENKLTKWKISAESELSSVVVYSSKQLADGSYILGTISNGIYHISAQGEFLKKINQEKGLNNNTILSIFEDDDRNLWLGLDNGISVINLNSPFSEVNDLFGKLGAVYASIIFKDNLYIGTNQGLYYRRANSHDEFKLVEQTKGQVWSLLQFDNKLFCGHNNGTFIIENKKAIQISDFPGTWDIKQINGSSDLLLQGNYTGLSILEKSNGKWKFRNKIEGFDISSRFFEFTQKDQIVVSHEFKGIFFLQIDPTLHKIETIKKESPKGIGSSIVNYQNELLYTSNNGVYKFDAQKNEFLKDSAYTNIFFSDDDHITGRLVSNDRTGRLWGFTPKNVICLSPGKFNNSPQSIKIPIPKFFRGNQGLLSFECVTHLQDNTYLIGASNGYTVLNLDNLSEKEYFINISAIYNEPSIDSIRQVSLVGLNTTFKSNENNLNIYFNVAEYDRYTEVYYQYKLEGLNDDWSHWSSEPMVSIKNLKFGEYEFNVRARIGNTLSSNIASYSFTIKRPWYISNIMIVIYILSFVFMVALIHFNYRRHYKKQQQKLLDEKQREFKFSQLENEKVIMKLKNEKLQQEVENKNRELTISTMSIIKKNEILNSIKKELMLEHSDDINEHVIKTIDKNINNKKDWEFIEDAFNNADKDFLKKIKKVHPNLTPNDLRFCAYLRLNLTSKEIAPLLNISVRSVEIKRYRLRKKMNLSHEQSLISYILEM